MLQICNVLLLKITELPSYSFEMKFFGCDLRVSPRHHVCYLLTWNMYCKYELYICLYSFMYTECYITACNGPFIKWL